MHKRIYGVFNLRLALSAESDILTRGSQDQEASSSEGHDVMRFFKAWNPVAGQEEPCIPATTFKGVLRSTAEKILRSFDPVLACDPFEEEPSKSRCACSHRLAAERESGRSWRSDQVYALLCPACRLFGSLAHAGLIEVEDAWAVRVVRRRQNGRDAEQARIAVDRFLGGAAPGAMYHIRPLPRGSRFETSLGMQNFALWQIGLLALALRELDQGQALIGWGTRRGLGRVSVSFQEMRIRYPRALYEAAARRHGGPRGVPSAQSLIPPRLRDGLGYPLEDLWLLQGANRQNGDGWRDAGWVVFELTDPVEIQAFLGNCVEEALAPRLRQGPEGFGYQMAGGE
jgi:CRISPR/Cas system CSM-associated protein Csm3 (group 7 of RAMP superfamily)